ncbi:PAS domain S-box protein [Thermodesulfobacteriota bacterium]
MNVFNLGSIRRKLALLILIAVLPALGILVYSGLEQRSYSIENAKRDALLLTHTMGDTQEEIARSTSQVLATLSLLPEIQALDIQASNTIFQAVLKQNPNYNNIALVDLNGDILASGRAFAGTNLADRKHFQNALATKDFAVGEYIITRMGETVPAFPFAYPLLDKQGTPIAVLTTVIKLASFSHFHDISTLPEKAFVAVTDHRGIRLYYYPAQPETNAVGKPIRAQVWEIADKADEPGIIIGVGSDGLRRIIAFEPIRLTPDGTPYVYVWAGFPEHHITSPAKQILIRNLLFMLVATTVSLFIAWLIGKQTIISPIKNLVTLTRKFAQGDLEVRNDLPEKHGEIGTLTRAFHEMAAELALNQETLRENEARFRLLMDSIDAFVYVADMDTYEILFVNQYGKKLLGDITGKICWQSIQQGQSGPCDFCTNKYLLDEEGRPGEVYSWEFQNTITEQWYDIRDRAIEWTDGRIVRFEIASDITLRKQTESDLEESETRYRSFVHNFQGIAFRGTMDFTPVFFHGAVEKITGYSEKEFISGNPTWDKIIFPDDLPQVLKHGEQMNHTPNFSYQREYRIVRKDGRIRWVYEMAQNICDDSGTPIFVEGTLYDITKRKQLEETLRTNTELISGIFNTVDDGFIVVDRDYRILNANLAYCTQVSLPCEEVVGKPCFELSHHSDIPCHEAGEDCAVKKVFETGEPAVALHKHNDGKGNVIFVETKAFPLRVDSDGVKSVIEVLHNVTERHLLEAEQLKSQKLESIGTLAGGIAHDFNNLLQGIFGFVSMAKLSADQPEKVCTLLDQAENALSMSVNLTGQLLTFAKGGMPVINKTDLRPLIENASRFALSGSRSDYRLTIPEDLWCAETDEGQISQVIQNIVLNASEAMPDGGNIDITAENVEIPSKSKIQLPDGGKFIKVMIRDTGVGILEKHLSKIFDPYFTTKHKGSGLGLATSYSIIRNHGGAIEVISQPDNGTTFLIYLPATEAEQAAPAQPSRAAASGKYRILVMDDDEIVLSVAKEMLLALGHDVEFSMDGTRAIELYSQAFASETPYDLVILDLTIKGGMGGEETVKKLLEIDPNVKAVVASGYSDNPVLSNFRSHGFSAVLNKPYTLNDLKNCLNSLTK